MQLLFEFADSEVSRVEAMPDGLVVRFAAAQVYQTSNAEPGRETVGYGRDVELVLSGARGPLPEDNYFGRVAQGRLELEGRWLKRIKLPFQSGGTIRLELTFANRAELCVSGRAVACRFAGEPNFSESLFC